MAWINFGERRMSYEKLFWLRRADNPDEAKHVKYHCHTRDSPLEALCGAMWGVTRPLDEYSQTSPIQLTPRPFCWKCRVLSWLRWGGSIINQPVQLGFYSGACCGVFALIFLMSYLFECMLPYYAYTRPDVFFFDFVTYTHQIAGCLIVTLLLIKTSCEIRRFFIGLLHSLSVDSEEA